MSTSLREAVARQIAALAKKIAYWEAHANDNTKAGIALMKAQVLHAHTVLRANDVLAMVEIRDEIERDHTNLSDFG